MTVSIVVSWGLYLSNIFTFNLTVSLLSRIGLEELNGTKKKTSKPAGLTLTTWKTRGVVFEWFVPLHHQAAQMCREYDGWAAWGKLWLLRQRHWVREHEQTAATNILWLSLCLNVFQSESPWKSVQDDCHVEQKTIRPLKRKQTSACSVHTTFFF